MQEHVCVKQCVMPLPATFIGDWFCVSRKGWAGEGGLIHPKGENSMAVSGPGCENTSLGSFLLF